MPNLHDPLTRLCAAVLLVWVAGCGVRPAAVAAGPRSPSPSPQASAPSIDERLATAAEFVTTALSYDSTTQTPTGFLDAMAPITTPAERIRLEGSGRAALNWPALQARGEKASIQIVSVTANQPPEVVVEATRTTTTSFATIAEPVEVRLTIDRVNGVWRVSSASGGGL